MREARPSASIVRQEGKKNKAPIFLGKT